jgi:hypothetical protein
MSEQEKEAVEKEEENFEIDLDEVEHINKGDASEESTPKVEQEEVAEEQEEVVEDKEKKSQKPSKFQKRIDDLTHRQKEAERQRDEYYKVASQTMEENKKLRKQANQFGEFGTKEMEGRINSEMESAKQAYKIAYEEGDADKILDAQTKMMEATNRRGELAQMKQFSDQSKQPSDVDRSIPPPPNAKAVEWASGNPWFNSDMIMTNAAYTIHDELLKQGISGDSDLYYERLDNRMKEEFPHKFSSDDTMTVQKNAGNPVNTTLVTPAGNQSPKKSRKVKLSPSQVAVAKRLGVPLEEYAKQFVALNN